MTTLTAPAPAADRNEAHAVALRSGAGAALVTATVLASMVGFLNARIVTVAVPAIDADLGASVAQLQWVVTGFLVTVTALLLLSGALADLLGRRRLLVAGLVITLAASVVCAVAPSVGTLIAARLAQGVGGALVIPSSLALLDGVLRPEDRARGIGIWAGLATLGSTAGPFAGGWLVDHASWRWIFLLNVPLVLGALVALRAIPETRKDTARARIDVVGALLAVLALGGVVYALNQGPSHGWLSAGVLVPGLLGVAAAVALVPAERRVAAPMVRLSLLRSRQFDAINAMTVLLYGAIGAASYLVVLQCQLRLGYSATQAGAVLIPQGAIFLVLAPVSGALVARVGPRRLMTAGVVLTGVAFAWLSQVQPGDAYATALLPPGVLWGVGSGLAVTPLTAAVLAAVGDRDLGEGSAINVVASRLGALVAIAIVPALIGAGRGDGLAGALFDGYEPAMLALAGLCAAAALVTWLFVTDARSDAGGVRTAAHDADGTCPTPGRPRRSHPWKGDASPASHA